MAHAETIWHAAIKDEHQGPLTIGQVIGCLREGLLNADDFAWGPGFDDWKTVAEFEEFLEQPLRFDQVEMADEPKFDDTERWSIWKRTATRLGLAFVVVLGLAENAGPSCR